MHTYVRGTQQEPLRNVTLQNVQPLSPVCASLGITYVCMRYILRGNSQMSPEDRVVMRDLLLLKF